MTHWLQKTALAGLMALTPFAATAEETPVKGATITVTYKDCSFVLRYVEGGRSGWFDDPGEAGGRRPGKDRAFTRCHQGSLPSSAIRLES